jgi:DsbC/DsbD-like thiol-disulfide interchange protein
LVARKHLVFTLLLGLALSLLAATVLSAEEPPTVTAQVLHSQSAYAAGGTYPLVLRFTIRPGFHINAQRPAEPDAYPTSLKWQESRDLAFNPAAFPPPHAYKPSFTDKSMEVHDGQVNVRVSFKVAPGAAPGPQAAKAKLEFQACDDQSCLMPETLEVPLTITVAPAGKPGQALNQELFKK